MIKKKHYGKYKTKNLIIKKQRTVIFFKFINFYIMKKKKKTLNNKIKYLK